MKSTRTRHAAPQTRREARLSITLSVCSLLLVLSGFFLARGIAGYTDRWRQLTPEQPFARLDRKYYSPLCLVLGLFFIILTLGYML